MSEPRALDSTFVTLTCVDRWQLSSLVRVHPICRTTVPNRIHPDRFLSIVFVRTSIQHAISLISRSVKQEDHLRTLSTPDGVVFRNKLTNPRVVPALTRTSQQTFRPRHIFVIEHAPMPGAKPRAKSLDNETSAESSCAPLSACHPPADTETKCGKK